MNEGDPRHSHILLLSDKWEMVPAIPCSRVREVLGSPLPLSLYFGHAMLHYSPVALCQLRENHSFLGWLPLTSLTRFLLMIS